MSSSTSPWSLTAHLLSAEADLFKSATQHPFLLAGAEGRLSKDALGRWLANDRLYIHSYLRAAARLLASLDLPRHVPARGVEGEKEPYETRLADWLIEALVAVRREERLFIDVAMRYGLRIEVEDVMMPLPPVVDVEPASATARGGGSAAVAKVPGLKLMEEVVFASVANPVSGPSVHATTTAVTAPGGTTPPTPLPWLEGAVTFWGTERCYLDAWTWARDHAATVGRDAADDADGGALRKEFIPNWSSSEFRQFVDRLGRLIDEAVGEVVGRASEGEERERVKEGILKRLEGPWKTLLEAEKLFWPDV